MSRARRVNAPQTIVMNEIERPVRAPAFMFLHEWWLEADKGYHLAGVLFALRPAVNPEDEAEQVIIESVTADLLRTSFGDALFYAVWLEPEDDNQPSVGVGVKDEWLHAGGTYFNDGVDSQIRLIRR
jgi:hypothetical protein